MSQDGCWNCQFRLEGYKIDFDNSRLFCNYDKNCPATYKNWALCHEDGRELAEYDENHNTINEDLLTDRHEKLYLWTRDHTVEEYKKCDYWTMGQ